MCFISVNWNSSSLYCAIVSGTSRTSAACTQLWSWMRWWLTSHRGLNWSCSTCLDHQRTEEETKTVSLNHNSLVTIIWLLLKINKLVTFTLTNRDVDVLFIQVVICSSPWLCPRYGVPRSPHGGSEPGPPGPRWGPWSHYHLFLRKEKAPACTLGCCHGYPLQGIFVGRSLIWFDFAVFNMMGLEGGTTCDQHTGVMGQFESTSTVHVPTGPPYSSMWQLQHRDTLFCSFMWTAGYMFMLFSFPVDVADDGDECTWTFCFVSFVYLTWGGTSYRTIYRKIRTLTFSITNIIIS